MDDASGRAHAAPSSLKETRLRGSVGKVLSLFKQTYHKDIKVR